MRTRNVVALLAILVLSVMAPWVSAYAQTPASTGADEDESTQGNELEGRSSEEQEADAEGGGADDEKDVGDAAEEEAVEEAGPPWTYQMAKLSLGLLVLLGIAIGAAWYKFVGMRQRGEA
ncbi:MAG TPA: hypothetical protein VNC78_00815 [Actinomycetota bacterium]|nr:hypothetical protein [Actinomycetota bacterium]